MSTSRAYGTVVWLVLALYWSGDCRALGFGGDVIPSLIGKRAVEVVPRRIIQKMKVVSPLPLLIGRVWGPDINPAFVSTGVSGPVFDIKFVDVIDITKNNELLFPRCNSRPFFGRYLGLSHDGELVLGDQKGFVFGPFGISRPLWKLADGVYDQYIEVNRSSPSWRSPEVFDSNCYGHSVGPLGIVPDSGRTMDFIASVIGDKPKHVFKLIKLHRAANDRASAQPRQQESAARLKAEAEFLRMTRAQQKTWSGSKLAPYLRTDEEGEFYDKPQTADQKKALDEVMAGSGRRKCLLRRRFARHWDMIWFLRSCGMCGRTLRAIYGSEALIWSASGGIDVEI